MSKILSSIIVLFAIHAYADQDVNFAIHKQFVTPRALALGGAINTMVDDYSALFFNPAALNRLKHGEVNAYISGALSDKFLDFTDDISKANEVGADDSTERQQAILDALGKYTGEHFHSRIGLGAIWARPGWGVGLIPVDLSIELGLHNSLGTEVAAEIYQDTTLAFGFAKKIPKWKGVTAGATVKAIYRGYIAKDLLVIDLIDDDIINDDDFQEGLSVDVDLAMLYEPHWWAYKKIVPTFSLVVRNVLGLGFTENFELLNDNSTEPPDLQRTIDIGSSWQLQKFWIFDPKIAIEVQDILHDYYSIKKGLHIGAELGWEAFSWLQGAYRLGINQGYLSAGVGMQLALFRLDVATWSEEVGTSDVEVEDRRYMVNMSLDF